MSLQGFSIFPGIAGGSEKSGVSDVACGTENVGNQFVWIPVTDETPCERDTSYADTCVSSKAYNDTDYLPDGMTDEETAVRNVKGFYISRYEAGKEGTSTLLSK